MQPKAVDAFCGAGGLSIGLIRAGFNVVFGFDIDHLCIETLRNNPKYISHTVTEADVRSLLHGKLLDQIAMERGELDLLAGGPPCQGFSIQRTIGGDQDQRNDLVEVYGDLVLETMPRLFFMENVPGIGGKRGHDVLADFEERMSHEGYFVHKRTLDASAFGIPQRRRRVILIGQRLDSHQPRYKWPLPSGSSAPTVRDTIGHLPPPPPNRQDHPDFPGHRADRLSDINKKRLMSLRDGQGRTSLPKELLANCHHISAEIVGHRNVYGRMAWDEVAPTITARFDSFTRGKFGHPEQIRTISLFEGALLQTFPPDFHFIGNKVEVARQIGNAVPPAFAEVLGYSLLDVLKTEKSTYHGR
jgi:DNA (cytosine-5)-methyltransferase 1